MTNTFNDGLEAAAKVADNYGCAGFASAYKHIERAHLSTAKDLAALIRALKRPEPDTSDPRDDIIRELRVQVAETGKRLRYLSDFCPNEEMDGNLEALARRCEDIANAELRDILAEALSKAKGVVDG